MIERLILQRIDDNGKRTIGQLTVRNKQFWTIEEPWNNNQIGKSCIPPGVYKVVPHGWESNTKVKRKRCYRLLGTEPRTAILIHEANTTDDIEGCIGPGLLRGEVNGKEGVLKSKPAMELIRGMFGPNKFELEIRGVK